jgi:hypothetical protein
MSASKKLKYSEPDLTVVVGSGDDQKTYIYHSVILAAHSDYIDTMLATPMKESETMKITFPDINPQTWEEIMEFITASNLVSMSVDKAKRALPWFDKYEFRECKAACNEIFSHFLEKRNFLAVANLPGVIEILGAAHEYGLSACNDSIIIKLSSVLFGSSWRNSLLHLTRHDIILLAPLLERYDTLWTFVHKILGDNLAHDKALLLTNPLFPDIFLERVKTLDLERVILQVCRRIDIRGLELEIPEIVTLQRRQGQWVSNSTAYKIEKSEDRNRWVLYKTAPAAEGGTQLIAYAPPSDTNSALPPRAGWIHPSSGNKSEVTLSFRA